MPLVFLGMLQGNRLWRFRVVVGRPNGLMPHSFCNASNIALEPSEVKRVSKHFFRFLLYFSGQPEILQL